MNNQSISSEEKNRNNKPLLIIAAIALVAVIAIVSVLAIRGGSRNSLMNQLSQGQKYLDELDYEQALACFLAAIEIDGKSAEAYLGAAEAYIGLGELNSAAAILRKGQRLAQAGGLDEKLEMVKGLMEEEKEYDDSEDDEAASNDEKEDKEEGNGDGDKGEDDDYNQGYTRDGLVFDSSIEDGNTDTADNRKRAAEFISYLDNTLTSDYGIADLSDKSIALNPNRQIADLTYDTYAPGWTGIDGIVDYYLSDFDGDGNIEMLLIRWSRDSEVMEIYENDNGSIYMADEFVSGRMNEYWTMDEAHYMVDGRNGTGIVRSAYYAVPNSGIYSNGIIFFIYNNGKLLRKVILANNAFEIDSSLYLTGYNDDGEMNNTLSFYENDGSMIASALEGELSKIGINIHEDVSGSFSSDSYLTVIPDALNGVMLNNRIVSFDLNGYAYGFNAMRKHQ